MKKQVKELSIERIRELLGTKKLSDEAIKKIMNRIKQFCKVAYELYLKKQAPKKPAEVIEMENLENKKYKDAA